MEVIDYFHEYKLDGILGLNADYVIANTSKYYSSHDLRLSYKGALETKEYLVSKLLSNLSLTPDHLPYMAVFLGGYILIDEPMLKVIYKKINIDFATDFEARIRKLAEIIRNSPTNDIDEFIRHLSLEEWAKELKESVEYFKVSVDFLHFIYQTAKWSKHFKWNIFSPFKIANSTILHKQKVFLQQTKGCYRNSTNQ